MKAGLEGLTAAYHAAGSSVYQQAQSAAQDQPSGSDFAGYGPPSDNGATPTDGAVPSGPSDAVEGEVVEGEVTEK